MLLTTSLLEKRNRCYISITVTPIYSSAPIIRNNILAVIAIYKITLMILTVVLLEKGKLDVNKHLFTYLNYSAFKNNKSFSQFNRVSDNFRIFSLLVSRQLLCSDIICFQMWFCNGLIFQVIRCCSAAITAGSCYFCCFSVKPSTRNTFVCSPLYRVLFLCSFC